ncbi:hypothetical protein TNCV_3392451 [Trichonephila clavipes]|nr:hypothetical protein TNCV_3392451 [Trichonephila clavipes]
MPHYSATRAFVILNHGQVTRRTPELAPSLLTSIPTGGRLSFDRFNVHRPPTHTEGLQRSEEKCHLRCLDDREKTPASISGKCIAGCLDYRGR